MSMAHTWLGAGDCPRSRDGRSALPRMRLVVVMLGERCDPHAAHQRGHGLRPHAQHPGAAADRAAFGCGQGDAQVECIELAHQRQGRRRDRRRDGVHRRPGERHQIRHWRTIGSGCSVPLIAWRSPRECDRRVGHNIVLHGQLANLRAQRLHVGRGGLALGRRDRTGPWHPPGCLLGRRGISPSSRAEFSLNRLSFFPEPALRTRPGAFSRALASTRRSKHCANSRFSVGRPIENGGGVGLRGVVPAGESGLRPGRGLWLTTPTSAYLLRHHAPSCARLPTPRTPCASCDHCIGEGLGGLVAMGPTRRRDGTDLALMCPDGANWAPATTDLRTCRQAAPRCRYGQYTRPRPKRSCCLGRVSAWRWAGWRTTKHSAEERRPSRRPGGTQGGNGHENPDSYVADGGAGDAARDGMP